MVLDYNNNIDISITVVENVSIFTAKGATQVSLKTI